MELTEISVLVDKVSLDVQEARTVGGDGSKTHSFPYPVDDPTAFELAMDEFIAGEAVVFIGGKMLLTAEKHLKSNGTVNYYTVSFANSPYLTHKYQKVGTQYGTFEMQPEGVQLWLRSGISFVGVDGNLFYSLTPGKSIGLNGEPTYDNFGIGENVTVYTNNPAIALGNRCLSLDDNGNIVVGSTVLNETDTITFRPLPDFTAELNTGDVLGVADDGSLLWVKAMPAYTETDEGKNLSVKGGTAVWVEPHLSKQIVFDGIVTVNIQPNGTGTGPVQFYDLTYPEIEAGRTYVVVFGGVGYEFTAWQREDGTVVMGNGNIHYSDEQNTGEPICLAYNSSGQLMLYIDTSADAGSHELVITTIHPAPDITRYDDGKVLGVVNGEPQWVNKGANAYVESEIYSADIAFAWSYETHCVAPGIPNGAVQGIVAGNTYAVTLDGASYECVAEELSEGTYWFGNKSLWRNTYDDTGEPFLVWYYASNQQCTPYADLKYAGRTPIAFSIKGKHRLPTFSSADNGKVLGVENGTLAWVAR